MKITIVGLLFMSLFAIKATAQINSETAPAQNKESELQIVEVSCGQCNFGLPGKGCELAVRIEGEAYFVDGAKIDDHGDAHASDGLCTTIRKAHVKGTIVDNRFKSKYFKVIALAEEESESK